MSDRELRKQLVWLLAGGNAHLSFEEAVADLPRDLRGARPACSPHTPWRLLEHLRICQWDILQFSRTADHESPEFPLGYWPAGDAPPDEQAWDEAIAAFQGDLQVMQELVMNPEIDLFAVFPWSEHAHLVREVLILADHNAYHLGQLVEVRRALGAWSK